ncbi:ABC transporter permease subunit [Rhizobium leguminosarum bv. viciae]|nr:ABC transporter permease subunit [Rhizobium leguminosarum bv. viciae]
MTVLDSTFVRGGAASSNWFTRNHRWLLLLMPAMVFLSLLFALPVLQILRLSFVEGKTGHLTLANYAQIFSATVYLESLWVTFKLGAITTLLCVLGGYPVAYLLTSSSNSVSRKLLVLVMLPFWTSFLVRGFAWMILLGRSGAVNTTLKSLGIIEAPLQLIYNFNGALIGMVHSLMPLFIIAAAPTMARIDRNLSKAAATMGASHSEAFWKIYFPLSVPGVAAGAILVFITSIGFFLTPTLLGGRGETVISRIIIREVEEGLDWGFAGALSVLLLATAGLLFLVYDRIVGISNLAGESKAKAAGVSRVWATVLDIPARIGSFLERRVETIFRPRPDRPNRSWSKAPVWFATVLVLVFLVLPIFVVIPVSLQQQKYLTWPPRLLSFQWYESFFNSTLWLQALSNSIIVGIGASLIATFIGSLAAIGLTAEGVRGRAVWLLMLILPLIVPHVIFAVGLFYVFAPLGLIGSKVALMLGHAVIALPYVVITVMAVMKNYDRRLTLAAWTMGASRWKSFWRIQFPLVRAGMFAAFLFAFVTSFDDLTISLFVTAGMSATLPKEMWSAATMQVDPQLSAVSTVVLLIVLSIMGLGAFLQARSTQKFEG